MKPAYLPQICMLCAVTLLSACGRSDDQPITRGDHDAMPVAPRPALPDEGSQAQVRIMATQGNEVSGQLMITSIGNGVRLTGEISGLPHQGEFGFHVHERGDCTAPNAASAGDHFNPDGHPHGHPSTDERHAGDLSNLKANDDGIAQVDMESRNVTLGDGGVRDILGKAVIVHALPDDFTSQPAGGTGDRLACGVISAQQ